MLRKIVATTCLTLMSFGAAMPAVAGSFGPLTSTYKGTVRVKATGTFGLNSARTGAQSTFRLTDPIDDGNNVYAKADTQFLRSGCSTQGQSWCLANVKDSKEYRWSPTQQTWNITLTATSLRGDSSSVRGVHKACAQMGFPVPDSCSSSAYVTVNY